MTLSPEASWETELGGARLVFGAGTLVRAGELVRNLGCGRVLVVTDPGIRDAGHVNRAVRSLEDAGVGVRVFDGVEENPTTRHVGHGVEAARAHGADGIVGLGGGSSMDCAKGINFLLTNGGRMEDYWGTDKARLPMLPSIGIPTTAGTGSEAQSYALITQEGTGAKMACGDKKAAFRAVILDPELPVSAPRSVAAATGMDAVSHAVESHVTRRRNPISQMCSREAWRLLEASFGSALANPEDVRAWSGMLLGAHLGGAAIERSMLGAAHACANPLTSRFRITHGIAVGLMLPHVIRFNAAHVGALYDELVEAGNVARTEVILDQRVTVLRALAGLPENLRDCSVPRDSLRELAREAESQWTAGFNPRPVRQEDLLELYEAAYA